MPVAAPVLLPTALLALLLTAAIPAWLPATRPAPVTTDLLQERRIDLTAEQEARAQGLEGRLKCPVCRTQSVRESTSFMALEMRRKIRQLVAAGRTDDEVLAYFAARYGDYILLEPRRQGFGLAAYALPFLAVLAGLAFLALAVRRRIAPPDALPEDRSARLDDASRARVEEELKRYTV